MTRVAQGHQRSAGLGSRIRRLIATALLVISVSPAAADPFRATVPDPAHEPAPAAVPAAADDNTFALIAECLKRGGEVSLRSADAPLCHAYGEGIRLLERNAQLAGPSINYDDICNTATDDLVKDRRILPGRTIKRLAALGRDAIDPSGVRIIGAIFCEKIDLIGLDIPYPLVLDRSIFVKDVEIRNFRSQGDVSLEASEIRGRLKLFRSRIGGSFYLQASYFEAITVLDTNINLSLKMARIVVKDNIVIGNTVVTGDLDLTRGYFSSISLTKSSVGGAFDFSQTVARCTYDIRNNEFRDVISTRSAFGKIRRDPRSPRGFVYAFFVDRNGKLFSHDDGGSEVSYSRNLFKLLAESRRCNPPYALAPGDFIFVLNRIKSSLCFAAPDRLAGALIDAPQSNIFFNDINVDGYAWISLDEPLLPRSKSVQSKPRLFSLLNFRAGTFISDFTVKRSQMNIKVIGLQFSRVYTSQNSCESNLIARPSYLIEDMYKQKKITIPSFDSPNVQQVLHWIGQNTFDGKQPFYEFVGSFEKSGDSDGAKDLRSSAKTAELMRSYERLTRFWTAPDIKGTANSQSDKIVEASMLSGLTVVIEFIQACASYAEAFAKIVVSTLLWLIADHGERPEQVIRCIVLMIIISYFIFAYAINVYGFSTEDDSNEAEPKIYPIGFIFLFDRMLPSYKISEKNYQIDRYWARKRSEGLPLRHLGISIQVQECRETQRKAANIMLNLIRLVGYLFAAFLIAAVSNIFH